MFIYSDLKNKNVIVTGANGDIGIAICQKYLEQQCHVYALYHQNRNNLDKLKKRVNIVTAYIYYNVISIMINQFMTF